jgi:phosphodiesterase/alkaline phosphatase D-like protein
MAWLGRDRSKIVVMFIATGMFLVSARPALAGQSQASKQIDLSPTVESVSDTLAFIRWTTPNPGGTILHYAVANYGTDPVHLDRTAKSPTRINPGHDDMIFRVRLGDLKPGTTYYYRVFSQQANGDPDSTTSTVNKFTTPAGKVTASNK